MKNSVKCANCKKLINWDNSFGVFVILEKDQEVDLGLDRKVYVKQEDGIVQLKICDDCLKRDYIVVNPYQFLREYYEEATKNKQIKVDN
jgi:hypothetical protein